MYQEIKMFARTVVSIARAFSAILLALAFGSRLAGRVHALPSVPPNVSQAVTGSTSHG